MRSSKLRSESTSRALLASMKRIAIGGFLLGALLFSLANILETAGVDPWAWARPERKYRIKAAWGSEDASYR